jgi:hypothetical protein
MRVGDGDGRYEEQWNLSGDRRVYIATTTTTNTLFTQTQ